MRKKEFLKELEEYLVGIPREEKDDILQDYKEHFKIGKKNNRSESEIIKSLGDPKEIARETRRELSKSNNSELKSEAIETWVATKKFTKNLLTDARNKISDVVQKDKKNKSKVLPNIILGGIIILAFLIIFNSWVVWVIAGGIMGYLFYDYFKDRYSDEFIVKKSAVSKSSKKYDRKISTVKLIVSLTFNLLFFLWFWVGIFFGIFGLFITGVSLMISGIAIIVASGFILIVHANPLTKDLMLAGIFSGIGVLIFGGLFTSLTSWIGKIYFRITRAYIELNGKFIKK
jgi:uncharacterized membrane protein